MLILRNQTATYGEKIPIERFSHSLGREQTIGELGSAGQNYHEYLVVLDRQSIRENLRVYDNVKKSQSWLCGHSVSVYPLLAVNAMKVESTVESEGRLLAEIRARAMKPSLEAIGRFDEHRVRDRFLKTFDPAETKKVTVNGSTVGFYVLKYKSNHIYLDHLYIAPEFHGRGFGKKIIYLVKKAAMKNCLPIRVGALRESKANGFYVANGFEKTHEDELDIYYEWTHC